MRIERTFELARILICVIIMINYTQKKMSGMKPKKKTGGYKSTS